MDSGQMGINSSLAVRTWPVVGKVAVSGDLLTLQHSLRVEDPNRQEEVN